MRITLVISSLGGGGAERVVTNMANYWASRGRATTVLTVSHGPRPPAYALHPQVVHRDVGFSRGSYQPVPDTGELRKLLEVYHACSQAEQSVFLSDLNLIAALRHALAATRPDVVLSFMDITNIRVLLAAHGLRFPVIVSERCDPQDNFLGAGRELLRWRLYPTAAHLAALNPDVLRHFSPMVGARGRVIPNPVLRPEGLHDEQPGDLREQTGGRRETGHSNIISLGRLAYEKGFDLLVYAFASVAARHPAWGLRVFGEGPLRPELETLARRLGLSGRVSFPGFTPRPSEALRRSDLFVLPSRSEGFGNVLTEAMACGLPVVSFDCPSGPRHIIRDGVDGVLVPPRDVPALAAALERLMGDRGARARLAARAPDVLERFGLEKVMAMWEQLVTAAAGAGLHA
jgi:glycosyltransferase involved in cell wall biosynthesis